LLVVITRPESKQAAAQAVYAAAGLEVLPVPLMTTEVIDSDQARKSLQRAQQADVVIFPSTEAVDACFALCPAFNPSSTTTVIAVGPATAERWRECHAHAVVLPPQHNSEGVVALLKTYPDIQRLCLITAPAGRALIHQHCLTQGILYDEIHVYQRLWPNLSEEKLEDLKEAQDQLVLTFTSVAALQRFEALITFVSKADTPVVCASERIAEAASLNGYRHILVAASASNQDMLSQVLDITGNR